MCRSDLRRLWLASAAAWVIAWGASAPAARGEAVVYPPQQPDLFYNFYVPPGPAGGVPAEMYVCPRPTPPLVGHTWVTYQPVLPHEFLYPHKRIYWRHHPGSGMTRTSVRWGFNPFNQVLRFPPRVAPTPIPDRSPADNLIYIGRLGLDQR